jgi:hypothetical protein
MHRKMNKKNSKPNPIDDLYESERDIDPEEDQVDIPFDPANVDIADMVYPVTSLLDRLKHGDLNLSPDFQRRANLWDEVKKSRLIESILLRIPLPSFYFSEDNLGSFEVVDGLQRLCAIFHFVDSDALNRATSSKLSPLRLSGLQYLSENNGILFSDMNRQFQRRILELQIHVNLIRATTPREVMFNVFARLNQSGVPLTAQEIRNAIYPGEWRERTRRMAESREFTDATRNKVPTIRQQDAELVLRFIALWTLAPPFRRPVNQVLDVFLNETVQSRLPTFKQSDWESIEGAFFRGLRGAVAIFDKDAFRSRISGEVGGRLNRGLFEAKMVAIAELSDSNIDILVCNRELVKKNFTSLFEGNDKFVSSLKSNTGSPESSNVRISAIQEMFKRVISAE